jgi:predicted metalloprotease
MPSYQSWGQPTSAWGAPPPPPPPPPGGFVPAYQQPGYGVPPGRFAPPPPRKKGNPLLAVLGGLAFVLILGFFVVALTNYLNAGGGGGNGNDPTYHQVNNVPAPDYNPPAIPQPKTYDQATTWMEKNAIYTKNVPVPTNCTVPYLDPTTASTTELEDHLNQLTACLWGVWEGPMTQAGFELPRPPATVYTSAITTPCGKADLGNAFYCGADQHIYYAKDLPKILPPKIRTKPFVTDAIMAHEFGHAIQARTGILIAEKAWEQKAGEAEGRVFSRRTEVQADCFAGLWVNAVAKASKLTPSDFDNLKYLFYNIGDDVLTGEANYDGDHGLSKNRQAWVTIGLGTDQIGKCNAFVAPKDAVR